MLRLEHVRCLALVFFIVDLNDGNYIKKEKAEALYLDPIHLLGLPNTLLI